MPKKYFALFGFIVVTFFIIFEILLLLVGCVDVYLGICAEHIDMIHQFPSLQGAPAALVDVLGAWPCFAQESLKVRK